MCLWFSVRYQVEPAAFARDPAQQASSCCRAVLVPVNQHDDDDDDDEPCYHGYTTGHHLLRRYQVTDFLAERDEVGMALWSQVHVVVVVVEGDPLSRATQGQKT